MKKLQCSMIWCLLSVLLCISLTGCSSHDFYQYLKQSEESQQVAKNPSQQEAEKPEIQEKVLEPPKQISMEKYAYQQLGQIEKVIYDEMLSAILDQEEAVPLSTTDADVMQKAYKAVCSDYGGLFWVDGYVFTRYTRGEELVSLEFSPKYTMTKEERREVQAQIDSIVEAWLTGISINDTDYDKAKYVYELLALNTTYVENAEDSQNIISVFLRQETVCQGYACAVQYLLGQLGIKSAIVSGRARGESHAWNLICLDGEYYYMDATWGNNGYRDKEGNETFFIDYNYMAMTTGEMQISHEPDAELRLPECTAVLNNYYIKEGNYIEEWQPELIGGKLAAAWQQQQAITLRFSDDSLKEQAFQYFIEEGNIADYCSGIRQINYIEDSLWKEISFCFNEEE